MVPFLNPRTTSVLAEIGDFGSTKGDGRETEPACAGTTRPSAASTGTPASRAERKFMENFSSGAPERNMAGRMTEIVRRPANAYGGYRIDACTCNPFHPSFWRVFFAMACQFRRIGHI
jgi:hypothetical protein